MMEVIRQEIEAYVKSEFDSDFNKWSKKDHRTLLDTTVDEYVKLFLIYRAPDGKDVGWVAGKTLTDGYAGFYMAKTVVLVEEGDDAEDLIMKFNNAE
jgi:hypothetical protein